MVKEMKKCFRVGLSCVELKPLLPERDLHISLCVKSKGEFSICEGELS